MTIHTLNSAKARSLSKTVYMLQLASATLSAPASFSVADVNAFILNLNGDNTKVTLASGASMSPTPVVSGLTSEGKSVVQALDLSDGGTFKLLEQTPEEYKTIKTAYKDKECRIVAITG
ncbi:unnamed protein product, partial [marine sediment metagenome]